MCRAIRWILLMKCGIFEGGQDCPLLWHPVPNSRTYVFLDYKDYSNLVKVDVVCQGVPSGVMFKKYISEVERKHRVKVLDANFRSKMYGWRCGLLLLLLLVQKGNKRYWMKRVFEKTNITTHLSRNIS